MELNQRLDQELTAEQKIKFQKDNGRFKLLNNIVLIPINGKEIKSQNVKIRYIAIAEKLARDLIL